MDNFGVRGMGSLPLLPRDLEPTLALETEMKLSLSLSLPSVPLPSGSSGACVFFSFVVVVPTAGGPLLALTGSVKVGRVLNSSLWTCLIGILAAFLI